MTPNMTWSGPGAFQQVDSVTDTEVWSGIAFVAHRDMQDGQFTCHTRFF